MRYDAKGRHNACAKRWRETLSRVNYDGVSDALPLTPYSCCANASE
jgi:hypothetical protein